MRFLATDGQTHGHITGRELPNLAVRENGQISPRELPNLAVRENKTRYAGFLNRSPLRGRGLSALVLSLQSTSRISRSIFLNTDQILFCNCSTSRLAGPAFKMGKKVVPNDATVCSKVRRDHKPSECVVLC